MQDLFELTPELLLEQSQEMVSLCADYENLFANISSDLNGANDSWSDLLAHNFASKISSAQKAFTGALSMMRNSANSIRTVAQTAQEMDDSWAARISSQLHQIVTEATGATGSYDPSSHLLGKDIQVLDHVDLEYYCDKVSDAEYAKLCGIMNGIDRDYQLYGAAKMKEEFLKQLQAELPANDPLRYASADQVQITTSASGFSAVTIKDGNNALVIFAGTDFSRLNGDYVADAQILAGITPDQARQAAKLVNELSKECGNIKVTGHSLGGYLATAATLENKAVSECVAFDPPGRKDGMVQTALHLDQANKVRTYKAALSPVSSDAVGHWGIGHVTYKIVSHKDNIAFHLVDQICDSLGGEEEISETWNKD